MEKNKQIEKILQLLKTINQRIDIFEDRLKRIELKIDEKSTFQFGVSQIGNNLQEKNEDSIINLKSIPTQYFITLLALYSNIKEKNTTEISKMTQRSRSTESAYLNKLANLNIIEKIKLAINNKKVFFKIKEDYIKLIYKLFEDNDKFLIEHINLLFKNYLYIKNKSIIQFITELFKFEIDSIFPKSEKISENNFKSIINYVWNYRLYKMNLTTQENLDLNNQLKKDLLFNLLDFNLFLTLSIIQTYFFKKFKLRELDLTTPIYQFFFEIQLDNLNEIIISKEFDKVFPDLKENFNILKEVFINFSKSYNKSLFL